MLSPGGHEVLPPGKVANSMPASLDSTNGGGEASDSPRPSKRCVDARKTSTPGASVYRAVSNDPPTASARPPGASTTGSTAVDPTTRRAIPSAPVRVSPATSTGALPVFHSSTYSPSLRGAGPGGEAITSEITTVGSGDSVVSRCDSP